MANADQSQWEDDRYCSSGNTSDDSPILSHRCEKRRFSPYTSPQMPAGDRRRSTLSTLSKFGLFCAAMILFCVLMYIPVYNKANYHIPKKGFVSGWSIHANRDTKIYVQPYNVTTLYQPKDICVDNKNNNKKKLFLLVIVCSSTENFEKRKAIRETWGHYGTYKKHFVIFEKITKKYQNYSYQYDLYPQEQDKKYTTVQLNVSTDFVNKTVHRNKRDISSFNQLLPVLAKAIGNISLDSKSNVPENKETYEKRFEDDDDPIIPGFDIDEVIKTDTNVEEQFGEYNYDSNIMKIPPKDGITEENEDLDKILNMIKQTNVLESKVVEKEENPDFRLVFLLGTPSKENSTVQKKIEEEIETYDDIVQEDFIDSYNNLTLKSIMMLKWVTKKCNDSVRYILKLDDDTYVNVPNLILNLRNRSAQFDKKSPGKMEYLLLGHVISGAKPIHNLDDKWFSPRYMYSGRVYPRYLSGGAGYCMTVSTAEALYKAALTTRFFHLEDIYITGMCASRATPRIVARMDPLFTLYTARDTCWAHAHITSHRIYPDTMRVINDALQVEMEVDRCERVRLTKVRNDRIQLQKKLKAARNKNKNI